MPTDNLSALEKWCEEKALEAHNSEAFSRNGESVEYDYGVFAGREEAFKEVLEKIRSDKANQRPHVGRKV